MQGTVAVPRAGAKVYLALVVLALVWGYTWVAIKIATADASPYTIAASRLVIATAILFALLALTRRSLKPTPFVPTLVLGLLQTTGWTLLQTLAVAQAGAGKSAVLGYTMPFWAALLAWPFLGERIAGLRWVALALAAAGLAFVVVPLNAGSFAADGLAVLAGVSWGASAVYAKRLRQRYDVELLSLTTWQMLWGTIPLVVLMLAIGGPVRWTASFVAAMAFMSVGGAALGMVSVDVHSLAFAGRRRGHRVACDAGGRRAGRRDPAARDSVAQRARGHGADRRRARRELDPGAKRTRARNRGTGRRAVVRRLQPVFALSEPRTIQRTAHDSANRRR